ncbi:DUF6583 family protein [Oceanobacillus profundus]|nr:DUF6583 family protein [Oceanobacillus profundus]
MEGTTNEQQKKGISKGLIALIVGIVVLAGGTALAFMLIKDSPKNAYFLAEKDTWEYMVERAEERYQPEFDWYEKTQTDKTASSLELTAEYNDPAAGSMGYGMDPATLINNSSIKLDSQTDMENKQVYTGISANIAGMEINDLQVFVTDEKVMVGVPFLEEVLQLNDQDFGPLLHEVDPATFTGEETLGLDTLFESAGEIFPEEYKTHIEDEYFKLIYDELPDDAFTSSDETVEVNGESINSEKIELHLTEQQFKDILTTVLDKMEKDDKLKEITKEQMVAQQFGGIYMEDELDTFTEDFEASITEAKDGIEELQIPDGLTSSLWIADNKIVQREFVLEMGTNAEELAKISITGSQLLTDKNQFFDYDVAFSDAYEEGTMNIAGDLNWKGNEATDSINLTVEDFVLSYDGTETLADGTREFNRVFTVEDPASGGGSLHWTGDATYEADKMNAAHQISLETPDLSQDMFTLNMNTEGQTIDSVETLSEDNVKDLGSMSTTELQEYFENDVAPSFQQWLFGLMSSGGMGF